jgi:hypothetical protein
VWYVHILCVLSPKMMNTSIMKKANPATWAICLIVLSLIALYISYTLRSSGTYQDDDIGHFLIARWSWKHPELLFDIWGRPAFTLLYAPIAPLGLTATRIYSAILAGLVCLGSALLAKAYDLRLYWLAALFAGLQPEFVRQGFSTLTELSLALWLCVALIAHRQRRPALMAFAAGWLPLARYETIPILAIFILILLKQRRFGLCCLALAPLLTWNGYWAFSMQDWRRLLFPFSVVLLRSTQPVFSYGTGPLWYYPARLPVAFGGLCFVLAVNGFLRLRFGLLQLCTIIVVAVLSLSYWKFPAAAVAGYIRHLAVLAPVVGVLATAGFESLFCPVESIRSRWAIKLAVLCAGLASLGFAMIGWYTRGILYPDAIVAPLISVLLLFKKPPIRWRMLALITVLMIAITTITHIQPFQLNNEQRMSIDAANWLKASAYRNRIVLAANVWFAFAYDLDTYDRSVYRSLTPTEMQQTPVGSIIVWDSHYAPRFVGEAPLSLEDGTLLRLIHTYQSSDSTLYLYEKVP